MTMATKPKTLDGFEFLNPLDGNTYTLPPYRADLFVDCIEEFEATMPALPDPWTMLTTLSPDEQRRIVEDSQARLSTLRTMSVLKTLDRHLPDADDPAKQAIIANVNALDFAFIYKVFNDWASASGSNAEDRLGED